MRSDPITTSCALLSDIKVSIVELDKLNQQKNPQMIDCTHIFRLLWLLVLSISTTDNPLALRYLRGTED